MATQPYEAMDAKTIAPTSDHGDRDDASRFLRAAADAAERGEWRQAQALLTGTRKIIARNVTIDQR